MFIGVCAFALFGCATVFKGYEDCVILENVPDSLRVYSKQVAQKRWKELSGGVRELQHEDTLVQIKERKISLRSNEGHILILKNGVEEKRIYVYPKISVTWFILDALTLTFGIDMYTGNWNYFDAIDASFDK